MLIIDDDVRTAIHEPDKDRQYADRIAVGLIELLADVRRVQAPTRQLGFLLYLSQCGLPGLLTFLDTASNLAPFTNQRVISTK
uniref:Uncharacterized protein n=1 Tax=Rhizobium rhizogenes TaxID=359 RepID=A0A7S4ZSQ2_RHIRH|nr:hypothetical protein pC5.7c_615 [Rhizobium rhizogenes]